VNVEVTVATAADMRTLGRRLAAVLSAGDLVILSGPLGAGKTTLTQGIGDGLGIRGPVTSPTFVIARVHPPLAGALRSGTGSAGHASGHVSGQVSGHVSGQVSGHVSGQVSGHAGPRPALVHADAYRLGSALELDDLDLDADTASSVTVVEWGEGLAEGLADDRLEITIVPGPAGAADPGEEPQNSPRTVLIRGVGGRWQDIELPPAELGDRL
jgi:tRNA threonylcarbamoyladenosine biosynthesis protein TsaE